MPELELQPGYRVVNQESDLASLTQGDRVAVKLDIERPSQYMVYRGSAGQQIPGSNFKVSFIEIPKGYNRKKKPNFNVWRIHAFRLQFVEGGGVYLDVDYRAIENIRPNLPGYEQVKSLVDLLEAA